jgi:hypothetical protein
MHELLTFVAENKTPILLCAGWVFSCFCSTMPALSPNAGYFARWAHNFLQMLAANPHKVAALQTPKESL